MKEQLITFETAKLAKEKGLCEYFNKGTEYVSAFYSEDGINFEETEFQQEDCIIGDRYFRPTQSLLQKWLREVHKIDVFCDCIGSGKYYSVIYDNSIKEGNDKVFEQEKETSYEESLEVGLQEGLKLVKDELD
jgi:hypothetical protein